MVWVALVLSILAIVTAAFSAWYTRDQAASAKAQVHATNTPDVQLAVAQASNDRSAGELTLRYLIGPHLDRIDLEIVGAKHPDGTPRELPVPTFGPGNHSRLSSTGELQAGDELRLRVIRNDNAASEEASFRLTCHAGKAEWLLNRRVRPRWHPRMVNW